MYIMNNYLMATTTKQISIVANYYMSNSLQAGTTSIDTKSSSVNGLLIMCLLHVTIIKALKLYVYVCGLTGLVYVQIHRCMHAHMLVCMHST